MLDGSQRILHYQFPVEVDMEHLCYNLVNHVVSCILKIFYF